MILEAKKLTKSVKDPDNTTIHILNEISFTIENNDFILLLGPSGSGKTTLLQIIGLMDSPTSGKLLFKGENTNNLSLDQKAQFRANDIGFVFQSSLLINELTLEENIIFANKVSNKIVDRQSIDELLDSVGLFTKKKHYPKMLSTGEAQRGAIARALVNSPALILADEPTANLDKQNKLKILDLLKNICIKKQLNILIASHDTMISEYSNRCYHLQDGILVME